MGPFLQPISSYMKNSINQRSFALILTLWVGCLLSIFHPQNAQAQAKEEVIPYKALTGYSIKPGMAPAKGFQGYMVYRRSNLLDIYSEGRRMPGDTIDFKRNIAITMMGAKSATKTEIKLTKVALLKGNLSMYFTSTTGIKLPKPSTSLYVGTIPKQLGMTGLRFYMNGKLIEEVYN